MFGSHVLDVVIGLIFLFMTVSLAASAITEAFSSLIKLRHTTLLSGIKALVNDPHFSGLAKDLYNHSLINPLADGLASEEKNLSAKPAYINGKRFAEALINVIATGQGVRAIPNPDPNTYHAEQPEGTPPTKTINEIINDIQGNDQLKKTLQVLYDRANQNLNLFQTEIAAWFDDAMDRVSGWYKRWTQLISFLTALSVSVLLNADAIHLSRMLWNAPLFQAGLSSNMPTAATAIDNLTKASLLGWTSLDDVFGGNGWQIGMSVLGWLIVAVASLLGAPFWFDTLQKISQVAGVGPNASKAGK